MMKTRILIFIFNALLYSVWTNWILADGTNRKVRGKLGENLLDLARREDIELEGACEGSIACSTCHVILESNIFKKLEEPTDEENDMLDLAFGLSETYVILIKTICML